MTYTGILTLRNRSLIPGQIQPPALSVTDPGLSNTTQNDEYDQTGASYYVIAVILVYGMSIVMLIASHIRKRHAKMQEDKQINKYLHDFQIVKDKQERDNYKQQKKGIVNLLHSDRPLRKTHRNLRKSLYPLIAMGIPGSSVQDLTKYGEEKTGYRRFSFMNRRESFGQSGDRRSIGKRLSLGLLSLTAPRTSTCTRQSSSFDLHNPDNIIEEESSQIGHKHTINGHPTSVDSSANGKVSTSMNDEKRVPSYIDLPAITISPHQALIGHQTNRINIMEDVYDDHVPFKAYIAKCVQEGDSIDGSVDMERNEATATTETIFEEQYKQETEEDFPPQNQKDPISEPSSSFTIGRHCSPDGRCEIIAADYANFQKEESPKSRTRSSSRSLTMTSCYHPSSVSNNLSPVSRSSLTHSM